MAGGSIYNVGKLCVGYEPCVHMLGGCHLVVRCNVVKPSGCHYVQIVGAINGIEARLGWVSFLQTLHICSPLGYMSCLISVGKHLELRIAITFS